MNDLKIHTIRTQFNNILCYFGLHIYSKSWVEIRKAKDYCPVCNMRLEKDDEFYLTINNSRLFPNCLIHYKCIAQKDSTGLIFMNFNRVTEVVYNNYVMYKSKYKTWTRRD